MTADQQREREKYLALSASGDYGCHNHAMRHYAAISAQGVAASGVQIADVGCGTGQFAAWLTKHGANVIALDWATKPVAFNGPRAYASAWQLPLRDKSVDWVASFDMLEHLLPTAVGSTLAEFSRVARIGFIGTVAPRPSVATGIHGEPLHMTVRPIAWWRKQFLVYWRAVYNNFNFFICRMWEAP